MDNKLPSPRGKQNTILLSLQSRDSSQSNSSPYVVASCTYEILLREHFLASIMWLQFLQLCNLYAETKMERRRRSKAAVDPTKEYKKSKIFHSKCCIIGEKVQQVIKCVRAEFPSE